MTPPNFIQRNRQRAQEAQEAQEERVELAAASLPSTRGNPFLMAADDLAAQWEEMRDSRDIAKDQAERARSENVFLAGRVDELTRELHTRTEFANMEIERLTQRADRATDDATAIRAKLAVIADAIRMVLDEERPVIQTRQQAKADFAPGADPQGREVPQAEVVEIGSLISRLAPVTFR